MTVPLQIWYSTCSIEELQGVYFDLFPNTAALSHAKPASVARSCDSCSVQEYEKYVHIFNRCWGLTQLQNTNRFHCMLRMLVRRTYIWCTGEKDDQWKGSNGIMEKTAYYTSYFCKRIIKTTDFSVRYLRILDQKPENKRKQVISKCTNNYQSTNSNQFTITPYRLERDWRHSCNPQLHNGIKLYFWVNIPTGKSHEVRNIEDIYKVNLIWKKQLSINLKC